MLWIVVGAALVVALCVFGWSSYTRRQTAKASAALDDAMKIFQARIRAPGEPSEPGEVTYVDEKNKSSDAERKFLEVASQYGRTRPGQVARYYAALSEVQLKNFRRCGEEFDSSWIPARTKIWRAWRGFNWPAFTIRKAKSSQAVDLYKQLSDKPTVFVPKPLVLLTLAEHYRKTDPAQATKLYNQVKQEYPDAAEQADQGLELLNAKS